MKSQESIFNPEKKVFYNIVFTEILSKDGKIIGYKSSDPDRKIIKLSKDSEKPLPGQVYNVEVLEDTDPSDILKGQYLVAIVGGGQVLTEDQKDYWETVDKRVDDIGDLERQINQSVSGKSKVGNILNTVENPSRNTRLKKKFGNVENLSGQNSDELNNDLEIARRDLRYIDENGKAEEGYEENFSDVENLISLRKKNLKGSIEKIVYLEDQIAGLKDYKNRLKGSFVEKNNKNQIITQVELESYQNVVDKIEELENFIDNEVESSPEAWYGYHVRELKKYKEQFSKGKIVETPSVREKAEKVFEILKSGQPVFIHGHLGSGKTEFARYVSENYFGKGFHMISGSKHMSPSEIYGHDILTVAGNIEDDQKELPFETKVENRLRGWELENKEKLDSLSVEEKEGERNRAQQRIIASLETGSTISDFHLGPIYRAMENGEMLIIDELNAIPHDILIGLNDLLTRRPGDIVKVQQDSAREIVVRDGFCVTMTGNLNQGDLEKYVERNELDSAFVSRIHSEEYGYLPQRKEGNLNEADESDELFTLMVVMTMDRQANLKLPDHSLPKMWNLAMASKVFQDVFCGNQVDEKFYFKTSGVNPNKMPRLSSTVMSIRNLKRIFDNWRNDGFSREFDYYIYENFLATSTDPNDRAYIYQVLQNQFGFFKSEGWDRNPKYGDGKNSLTAFNISVPKNKINSQINFMGPREVVDVVFGNEGKPERKVWPIMDKRLEIIAEESFEEGVGDD